MSMKKLADQAIGYLDECMSNHVNSMCASTEEVHMAAMACRIQELEHALDAISTVAAECDGWESFPPETLDLAISMLET